MRTLQTILNIIKKYIRIWSHCDICVEPTQPDNNEGGLLHEVIPKKIKMKANKCSIKKPRVFFLTICLKCSKIYFAPKY